MQKSRLLSGVAILIAVAGSFLLSPGTTAQAAPKLVFKAVSVGFVDTCALTTKGAVKCWGYNGDGELGNGTKVDSAVPVGVSGLGKNVKAISSGSYFTCALTTKGAVKCWGSNTYGQLGDNTTTDSATPVAVYGLGKGIKAIAAGNFFACALTTKGAVKCWGANTYGQLGNGTTTSSAKPVGVTGLGKGVKALAGGGYHACAVTTKGAPKCWGYNGEGELGDNTKVNSSVPVAVYSLSKGVKAMAAGSYTTCALTTKNQVKCWGYNGDGELGDGTTTSSLKPVLADGLGKKVKAIAYGDIHGCAVNSSGVAKCWGYNGYGALGDNTTTTSSKPVEVYNMGAKVKAVAGGGYHSCALTTKGVIKCWGFNAYGQLGDGTATTSHKPVRVLGT
jgi:alpha-tubulin suppressor-like RCC1 family protein